MKTTITNLPKSEVQIEGEISQEIFESYEQKAIDYLGENTEISGFRKGKAPIEILKKNIPDIRILEEMAELALAEHYPKIIIENKIDAIGRPFITLTKIARGNPLCFTIKTAIIPKIELPDYKKIAKNEVKKEDISITDEDVEKTILDIRKMRANQVKENTKKDEGNTDSPEEKTPVDIKEQDLPPFDEVFVASLGGGFKDIEDFKIKLRENMLLEKQKEIESKNRATVVEKILEETKGEVPNILVNEEIERMLARFKHDISQSGLSFEDYLNHIKKTEDEIKKDWENDAEKRVKIELILAKIAEIEKIKADEKELDHELSHLLEHHKDADKERARAYLENILTNEKVFQFLLSK